jgi:UDP-glucose 4-epimerase
VPQVTEETPLQKAASPYGSTKQIGEDILQQTVQTYPKLKAILLRYFNPVGAHPSNEIGEIPIGPPANLVPAITQTAIGKLPQMQVYGSDYNTRDGSCVRDYIHVSDIAHAHTLAIQYLEAERNTSQCDIFNLGSGNGYTVLEAIKTFNEVNDQNLNFKLGDRRPGDVEAIYANNDKASKVLGWQTKYDLKEMMRTAWAWEIKNSKS